HNAKLDRWGNSMEFINGVAAGALNPFISAGEALGIGDILYGTRYAIDKAAMRNIAPLPAEGKFAVIGGLGSVAGFEKNTREAVDRWIQENPNAAETVEALVNVLPFAKVKNLTKAAKPGKAAVSGDFSKSYTCSFHGSTLVKTADGYKAIAHIQAGDRVFAKDEASGKTGYKPVTARYGNPYQETVYIEISDGIGNNQTLISNKIHPFYSQGKWIQAGRLKKGDTLLSESGAKQTVQNITFKQQPLKAYNLTVADWHTYFVKGSQAETEGVWVHNDCPYDKGNQRYKDASYHGKNDNSVKSRAPTNGQAALDNSVQVKSTSPRRVGVDKANNEIVVLDKTQTFNNGFAEYHGHVRSWQDLHTDQKNALKKAGLVNSKGKIKK
ncbi:MafB family polymorphic toxin, partial [Neisseria meningitidis]